MEAKVWWTSKTLWFNAISLAVLALSATELKKIVPDSFQSYIAYLLVLGNLALRTLSSKGPVTSTQVKAEAINFDAS